jgi:hypothetical protein
MYLFVLFESIANASAMAVKETTMVVIVSLQNVPAPQ